MTNGLKFGYLSVLGFLVLCMLIPAKPTAVPASSPSNRPLTAFEFRGLKVGMTQREAMKQHIVKYCDEGFRSEGHLTTSCWLQNGDVGGVPTTGNHPVWFEDGKLDYVAIQYPNSEFSRMEAAMTQAYGPPCESTSKPLQNAFGAKFSGDERKWCFSDGELTLRRHSTRPDNISTGDLDFFPTRPSKPAVRYTSATL